MKPSTPHKPARAVMLCALVCLGVAACGSSSPSHLNTAKVAVRIEQTITKETGVATTVSCPGSPLAKSGVTFTCVARLAVGDYPVQVTEIDAKGGVRFASATALQVIDSVTIEHAIARSIHRKRHLSARVHCPAPVLQSPGLSFTCVATSTRATERFTVTEIDTNGHVRIVDHSTHLAAAHSRSTTTTHTRTTATRTTHHHPTTRIP